MDVMVESKLIDESLEVEGGPDMLMLRMESWALFSSLTLMASYFKKSLLSLHLMMIILRVTGIDKHL